MYLMLVTLEMFKFDKSNEVRLEQLENMLPMFFTLEVFKFDKSNEVRLEQLENM